MRISKYNFDPIINQLLKNNVYPKANIQPVQLSFSLIEILVILKLDNLWSVFPSYHNDQKNKVIGDLVYWSNNENSKIGQETAFFHFIQNK